MIVEQALRLAGDAAHMVARPGGRAHVYTGPLTRSGRYVPRSARALCRAHTRRLEVLDGQPQMSSTLDPREPSPRVCARCSARLALRSRGRAEQQPTTRSGFLGRYADLTKADVAFALELARTPAEVDAAAHLSLVLFDVAGTVVPFTARGRGWPPLHDLVVTARGRVAGFPSREGERERLDAISAAAQARRQAERAEVYADRESRIARLGFTNATAATGGRRGQKGTR